MYIIRALTKARISNRHNTGVRDIPLPLSPPRPAKCIFTERAYEWRKVAVIGNAKRAFLSATFNVKTKKKGGARARGGEEKRYNSIRISTLTARRTQGRPEEKKEKRRLAQARRRARVRPLEARPTQGIAIKYLYVYLHFKSAG